MKKRTRGKAKSRVEPFDAMRELQRSALALDAEQRAKLPLLVDRLISDLSEQTPKAGVIQEGVSVMFRLLSALDRLPVETLGPIIRPYGLWLARVNSNGEPIQHEAIKRRVLAMRLASMTDNKLIPLVQDFFYGPGIELPARRLIPAPYPDDAPLTAADANARGRITRPPAGADRVEIVAVRINEESARRWWIPARLRESKQSASKRAEIRARWKGKLPALSAATARLYAERITDFFWLMPEHGKPFVPQTVWFAIQRKTKSGGDSPMRPALRIRFEQALTRML